MADPSPMPATSLRDVLESRLSPEAKLLAVWLAFEGPASRDAAGAALKLAAWEVEAACRDLGRPQVRWMPRQFDSGALALSDDCPVLQVFKKKKPAATTPTKEPTP